MKISFYNIGCKLNFAEISQIQHQFVEQGFEVVDSSQVSDVVLINTCTVTNNADSDSRKYIRRAIKNNPNAFIAVMGCYSQLKPDEVVKIDGVDAVFGTSNKFDITKIITNYEKRNKTELFIPDLKTPDFHYATSIDNESRTRMVFKIQDGCDYLCTYCTIPKARGKSRSMDFNELKNKLIKFNDSDFHEIVLTGINIGEYEAPTGEKFVDVVRLINNLDLKYRIRISSIEPNLLTDEIIDITKGTDKICNHFHIPLQSGSPEILQLMKRRYKVARFENLIKSIKKDIPDCCIGVDVIEGFPGENQQHFEQTYELLEHLPISYLHVFTYSARDNTEAANYSNQVPYEIKKSRTKFLREVSDRKNNVFINSQINSIHKVIPEKHKIENGKIVMSGWTDNYIRIEYESKTINYEPTIIKILKEGNNKGIGEITID